MSKTYSAAVVGGGFGGKLSMSGLHASARFDLVAACDLRRDVCDELQSLYPGLRVYDDHEAMFRDSPTDVVCVSTYPPSHEAVSLAALASGVKGLLVEKPIGDTAASGSRILEAIKAAGIPVAVPHGLLVKAYSTEILARVRRGDIGALKLVEIQCQGWDIINAGIHWLNFFVALNEGDPPVNVLAACDASTRTWRDGMQVETLAVTSAETAGGVRVVMHTGDLTTVNCEDATCCFRLVGTAGIIEFWAWEPRYRILNSDHPAGRIVEVAEDEKKPHQKHLENLAAQMDAGVPDYAVAVSSLLALEMCEAAYQSSRERRAISLPLEDNPAAVATDWDPGRPYGGSGGGRDGRQFAG